MTPDYPFGVGIIASGHLASRLAEICARSGCAVTVVPSDGDTPAIERMVVAKLLASLRRDLTEEEDIQKILDRITYAPYTSLAACQFVFDASGTTTGAATALRRLDALVSDPDATLVQIDSEVRLEDLARGTSNPGRVVLAELSGLDSEEVSVTFGTCHLTDPKTVFKATAFTTIILGLRTQEYRDDLALESSRQAAHAR